MAQYTIKIRTICEAYNGFSEPQLYADVEDIIEVARPKIFDFTYPIWKREYNDELERKILSHYYMCEIGVETPALFKLMLRNKMREIMPYYNKLLDSELIEFNPMHNKDVNTVTLKKDEGDTKMQNNTVLDRVSETKDAFKSTTAFADTPQGNLPDPDVAANNYITNATINNTSDLTNATNKDNTDVTGESDYRDKSEFELNTTGKDSGESFSKFLDQFRETFLNIDLMIIDELKGLFMGVNVWRN